jgi:hypothetical protein
MKDFGAAGGKRVGFIIAQVVEKPGFSGVMGIGGIDSIHVCPDDEFLCVHNMSDDRAGKIGAVAAKRGDAAVGSGADEPGHYGYEAVFEKREEDSPATGFGFFQMGLGITESVASENKIGRGYGNSRDSRLFQGGGEETRAEAFAKGSEPIGEFSASVHAAVLRHFVEKIAGEELEAAADTFVCFFVEVKVLEDIKVEMD